MLTEKQKTFFEKLKNEYGKEPLPSFEKIATEFNFKHKNSVWQYFNKLTIIYFSLSSQYLRSMPLSCPFLKDSKVKFNSCCNKSCVNNSNSYGDRSSCNSG